MSIAQVLALLGVLVGVVGVALDATWVWASGVATTVWFLLVASSDHEGIRGFLGFFAVPVILTVAVLAAS